MNPAANEPTGRTPMGDDAESPGEQTLSFEPIRDEEGTDLADAADRPTRPTVPRGERPLIYLMHNWKVTYRLIGESSL